MFGKKNKEQMSPVVEEKKEKPTPAYLRDDYPYRAIGEPITDLDSLDLHKLYEIKCDVCELSVRSQGINIKPTYERMMNGVEVKNEDGTTRIFAAMKKAGEAAKEMIKNIVKEPEVGEEYNGEVVGIKDFGAFVRLTPGKDGLLHISKIAKGRINKVEDVLNVGDEVKVVITDIDRGGKISLDRLDKPEVSGVSYEVVDDHDKNDGGGYEGRAKRRR